MKIGSVEITPTSKGWTIHGIGGRTIANFRHDRTLERAVALSSNGWDFVTVDPSDDLFAAIETRGRALLRHSKSLSRGTTRAYALEPFAAFLRH
ncbi:hypothetical protein [Amorphus orientalis]|uniref:Uncharacterized protein n=1 Tax=Amorphus orientalis TaxID=649198 RepID=A0AAE4AV17_9HYPH|nr:hypothetical protein [Amorphus orientalis]MDQ0317772.1 hypothetical protein [Amorphus orientalis]